MNENNVNQNTVNESTVNNMETVQPQAGPTPIEQPQVQQQVYTQPQPVYTQPQYVPFTKDNVPEEYKPISMWGYFGYELLFAIPLVGFILLLVFSFGGARNINLRNFARSYFCILIIAAILALLILIILPMVFGASAGLSSSRY